MDPAPDRLLLDEIDAAKALKMPLRAVRKLTRRGCIPYVDLGDGRARYLLEDLGKWVESRRRPTEASNG